MALSGAFPKQLAPGASVSERLASMGASVHVTLAIERAGLGDWPTLAVLRDDPRPGTLVRTLLRETGASPGVIEEGTSFLRTLVQVSPAPGRAVVRQIAAQVALGQFTPAPASSEHPAWDPMSALAPCG